MAKVTMTLYEALTKKKIYEDQLRKYDLNSKTIFGHYSKLKNNINGVDLETAGKTMIGNFQSYIHIRSNIFALQVAINKANLENTISIPGWKHGAEVTIVEAVTLNQKLDQEINFVNMISRKLQSETDYIEKQNATVLNPDYIYSQVSKQAIPDKKSEDSAETLAKNIESYKENNTVYLFDPNKIVETGWIEGKIEEINAFKAGLHTALMTANSQIILEVELED